MFRLRETIAGGLGRRDYSFSWRIGVQWSGETCPRTCNTKPDWVFLYQYGNESNPQVHYETTGPEILNDVPDITHFVAGLGTSGTLMGVGRFLRERKKDIQILAVEPPSGEAVQGLRSLEDGFIPPIFENWKG